MMIFLLPPLMAAGRTTKYHHGKDHPPETHATHTLTKAAHRPHAITLPLLVIVLIASLHSDQIDTLVMIPFLLHQTNERKAALGRHPVVGEEGGTPLHHTAVGDIPEQAIHQLGKKLKRLLVET